MKAESMTVEGVLYQYLKNLVNVKTDYERLKDLGTHFLTVDFSEIFLYMFHTRSARPDLGLVNYLFDRNLRRDYTYVILPPTILEMRMYYERMRAVADRYKSLSRLESSGALKKLCEAYIKLQHTGERIDMLSPACQEVLRQWKKVVQEMKSFDFVLQILTEYGSRYLLDEAHGRLVSLLKSGVVRGPGELDVLGGQVQNISSNRGVFDEMLTTLNIFRPHQRNYISNLVDAEHAAIDYAVSEELLGPNEIVSVFTGSPRVLQIFEEHLKTPKDPCSLVRSPVYMMIRTFCSNDLKDSPFDRLSFLTSGIAIINDLLKGAAGMDPIAELRQQLARTSNANEVKRLHMKVLNYQTVFDIFYMNERFADRFGDALKSQYFNRQYSEELLDRFYNGRREDIATMEMVETSSQVVANQKYYEDRLAKAAKKIFDNACELYKEYLRMLEDIDFTKLSPIMKEHYDMLREYPESGSED